ncbi:MAG: hypothetical protein JWO32_1713, partial [Bacteroidetes bacterium]|nr:hypothetical protein [Bacteroidota bacterium]
YEVIDTRGVKKIIKSKGNMVWLLRARMIMHCDLENKFKSDKEIIFNQYIDDIYEDSKGILWICAMNGLWNYKDDSLSYLGENNKLLSGRIIDILEDYNGHLWMATRGKGVIIKSGEVFHNIKQTDGLASNMCRDMFIDKENTVWVGSNNGLSNIKYLKERKRFEVNMYSKKQGLLSNEVNYIIARDNDLLLAHNNGITIIKPHLLKNNSVPPPVYITQVMINNKIYKSDSLQLNYSRNYFKVNYIGLSYKNQGTVEYKYKMEGLDTSWVYTGYTSAQFQTLNPGDYKFIVYAKNNDGYWSSKPATLYLTIFPAWWQTWAFRLLAFIILVAVIYILIKKRLDKIKKRDSEKEELQSKISTAELKALRAQMNPHFIFNAINSVQYFITRNDPESSQKYLAKFARLIRYVVENSKPALIPLKTELEALNLYLELESLRFENRFNYSVTVSNNVDINFAHIPSMLMQPYVENAIWHGLMHKNGKGNLIIAIELKEEILKCTISDDGVGRKKSAETKSAHPSHKSMGMSITKERLDIINQMNNTKLSVVIEDLTDEQGNATGTSVKISIPMQIDF